MKKIDTSRLFAKKCNNNTEPDEDELIDDEDSIDDTECEDDDFDIYDLPFIERLQYILNEELSYKSYARGYLKFKVGNTTYKGVPMAKINSNRYVFDLSNNGGLKAFNLTDMTVM